MDESVNRILEAFDIGQQDVQAYSSLTLAYVGDAVYEVLIRTILVSRTRIKPNELHALTTSIVQASAQSTLANQILPLLTQEEEVVYRRGRNAKSGSVAKNARISDYRRATGLESLVGYLYLSGQGDRLLTLLKTGLTESGLIE